MSLKPTNLAEYRIPNRPRKYQYWDSLNKRWDPNIHIDLWQHETLPAYYSHVIRTYFRTQAPIERIEAFAAKVIDRQRFIRQHQGLWGEPAPTATVVFEGSDVDGEMENRRGKWVTINQQFEQMGDEIEEMEAQLDEEFLL